MLFRIQRFFWLTTLGLTLAILDGCVSAPLTPIPINEPAFQAHQAKLDKITKWMVNGKLGVKTKDDGGSAYLHWEENGENYDIHLSGALGMGSLHINGGPDGVMLEDSKHKTYAGSLYSLLAEEKIPWNLPLDHLLKWVKGQPSKNKIKHWKLNEAGYLAEVDEDGWHIIYDRYQDVNGIALPHKLIAESPELKVTLVVNEWQIQ